MLQALQILQLALSLLPQLLQIVTAVEGMLPGQGKGAQKLDYVRRMLESAFTKANTFGVAFSQLWPVLSSMVGTIVSIKNETGEFIKPKSAAPAAAPAANPGPHRPAGAHP